MLRQHNCITDPHAFHVIGHGCCHWVKCLLFDGGRLAQRISLMNLLVYVYMERQMHFWICLQRLCKLWLPWHLKNMVQHNKQSTVSWLQVRISFFGFLRGPFMLKRLFPPRYHGESKRTLMWKIMKVKTQVWSARFSLCTRSLTPPLGMLNVLPVVPACVCIVMQNVFISMFQCLTSAEK